MAAAATKTDHNEDGRRRISAVEIRSLTALCTLLEDRALRQASILRVIHVQNASWANKYLLRKFNMEHDDDIVGTAFGRWARFERPQRRARKPVLMARVFPSQRDPWRAVSRCAFGLDYLTCYDAHVYNKDADAENVKMAELNTYDALETPVYGYDVFVQRLSVYVQYRDPHPDAPGLHQADFEMSMRNPYNHAEYAEYQRLKRQYERRSSRRAGRAQDQEQYQTQDRSSNVPPHLDDLDNGSTIIVFENSQSKSPEDTVIQARNAVEARWRRLPFYLRKEQKATDEQLTVECMDLVLKDVFKSIALAWYRFLRACETHVSILEDKIYEKPADETRAPELWLNSSLWLKVEKLIYLHIDLAKDVRNIMKDVTGDYGPDEWISQAAEEFDKIANSVTEDLIKPTSNLGDMIFKSVEIRDSRLGLQLDSSIWRLSWITFIFLPLTFISGFFGMNLDIFSKDTHNPTIKWYFIVTVPLMVLVALSLILFKHAGAGFDNDPTLSRRGVYEHLFNEFNDDYPLLWTREGPRPTVATAEQGASLSSRLKWRLVCHWFDPNHTTSPRGSYRPTDNLGPYARLKRNLARRWLRELDGEQRERDAHQLADLAPHTFDLAPVVEASSLVHHGHAARFRPGAASDGSNAVPGPLRPTHELAYLATQVAAEAEPPAALAMRRRMRSNSSNGRPDSSSALGAAMVEVETSDLGGSSSGDDSRGRSGGGRRRSSNREDRLHVGFRPAGT